MCRFSSDRLHRRYPPAVDVSLAIASRRDRRRYAERGIEPALVQRILDAGRLSGSARNRQPWQFVLVEGSVRDQLAETVYVPDNVRGAALVVAVVGQGKGPVAFDCGRASQNMLLEAWNAGLASTPNGVADHDGAAAVLGLGEEERLQIVLTFGHPKREPVVEARTVEEWSAAANRRPLDELVRRT